MTHEQLIEALRSRWFLHEDEIDAIFAEREFFQPCLKTALAKRAALGRVPERPIDATDTQAIFFLADWADTSIVPDLLRCLRMSDEDVRLLYSDSLTEYMWIPFAKIGHTSLDEIWKFVIDSSVE